MPETSTTLTGLRLVALRDCAANPEGLRASAHPATMPTLEAMGLVERRRPVASKGKTLWFLTPAGEAAVDAMGLAAAEG